METEFIYGRQPVFETIRGFREVYDIYATRNGLKWLREKAKNNDIDITANIKLFDKRKLYNLIKRADHQGIAARVEKYRYISEKYILDRMPSIILIADSITDPQNLGAMIRSANLLGIGAVIIPQNNSAYINSVVVHSSAGATEHTPICKVESISHFINLLHQRKYTIVSTVKPHKNAISIKEFKPNGKIAIIFGSEGIGISRKIVNLSDIKIYIPQYGEIDSFNVSVATGIVLFWISQM